MSGHPAGDRFGSRPCENSSDRAAFYEFQPVFGRFRPLQARQRAKTRSRCAVCRQFPSFHTVWVENRRLQRVEKREVRLPLLSIFKRGMISNTALACWWMAGGLVTYYSINGMFATHLQDRKSTRLNSSHLVISYAVFCLKK